MWKKCRRNDKNKKKKNNDLKKKKKKKSLHEKNIYVQYCIIKNIIKII